MDPTPPPAPVTSTSPDPGSTPPRSSASTESIAVKPAVPTAAARAAENPAGTRTSDAAGTRTRSASPPSRLSPRPAPLRTTRSPGLKASDPRAATVPPASMPATSGLGHAMPGRPPSSMPSL